MARNPDKHPRPGEPSHHERTAARQEEQRRANRRRTLLIVGSGLLLALAVLVLVWLALRSESSSAAPVTAADLGAPAAAAGCDSEITDPASGVNEHVGPGTDRSEITRVRYSTVPPTSGAHFPLPAAFGRSFYTERDRPAVENLVHNLEHGYAVVWYSDAVPDGQVADLRELAGTLTKERGREKLVVSAWDPSYGSFPAGKTVAFARWGADQGYRQLCGQVSGQALRAFMDAHPSTDSPEPNAA